MKNLKQCLAPIKMLVVVVIKSTSSIFIVLA